MEDDIALRATYSYPKVWRSYTQQHGPQARVFFTWKLKKILGYYPQFLEIVTQAIWAAKFTETEKKRLRQSAFRGHEEDGMKLEKIISAERLYKGELRRLWKTVKDTGELKRPPKKKIVKVYP